MQLAVEPTTGEPSGARFSPYFISLRPFRFASLLRNGFSLCSQDRSRQGELCTATSSRQARASAPHLVADCCRLPACSNLNITAIGMYSKLGGNALEVAFFVCDIVRRSSELQLPRWRFTSLTLFSSTSTPSVARAVPYRYLWISCCSSHRREDGAPLPSSSASLADLSPFRSKALLS